jgi:hypothetical protein
VHVTGDKAAEAKEFTSPAALFFRVAAISCNVSCMNPATASRACSSFFMFSSFFKLSWKVDGSMLGKSRSAKGKRNSMKGTMTKMANGTRRNKSIDVRISWENC